MKSTFLKVMGILCIVFGGISLVISGLAFVTFAAITAATGIDLTSVGLFSLLSAVIELTAGIIGVVFCTKPDKVVVPRIFAVLMMVMSVVSYVITLGLAKQVADAGAQMSSSPLSLVLGLVVPVLYLISTFKFK